MPLFGEQNHSFLLFTVHHDAERLVESDMPHELRFLDRRHGIEHIEPADAVGGDIVDGEVAHTETGEILEEVRALAGVYICSISRAISGLLAAVKFSGVLT